MFNEKIDLSEGLYQIAFDEFFNDFIMNLESEIIPEIFLGLDLPKLPSRYLMKGYELRSLRFPKLTKEKLRDKDPYSRSLLIQEIASLKERLNGHGINESINIEGYYSYNYSSEVSKLLEEKYNISELLADYFELYYKEYLKSISKSSIQSKRYISYYEHSIINLKNWLEFDNKTEKLIYLEDSFRRFISFIELFLIDFINQNQLNLKAQVYLEKEYEKPDLDNIIISISNLEMSTQDKLALWDTIDKQLRDYINKQLSNLSKEERNEILSLNQKFYTNIEL